MAEDGNAKRTSKKMAEDGNAKRTSKKMAEDGNAKRTSKPTSAFDGRFLFRSLGVNEDWRQGLEPRCPTATLSVVSHLSGKKNSQFISTTATLEACQEWADLSVKTKKMEKDAIRIVRIDVKKMKKSKVNIIDLTNPTVLDKEIPDKKKHKKQRNYATHYKEILVEGNIAADCITLVYPANDDNLSSDYTDDDNSSSEHPTDDDNLSSDYTDDDNNSSEYSTDDDNLYRSMKGIVLLGAPLIFIASFGYIMSQPSGLFAKFLKRELECVITAGLLRKGSASL